MVLEIVAGGARLQLLPQRAAYLPDENVLLIADAHIGKAVSFRKLGVPVPGGTTGETLRRLDALLQATGAQHIVFLGDLLHSVRARAPETVGAVARWRAAHPGLQLTLVRGNHDSHAGDPPADWGVQCVNEPFACAGLALCHHPDTAAKAYVLAGHVHPAAIVGGRTRERLRLPCFHFGATVGVLPAFGEFTGMHTLPQGPQDRVYVTTGDVVREVLRTVPHLHLAP